MASINHICQFMEKFAPTQLAEDWDNVGLLVG
ncbi:MAG: Nif3-like dinuclear metal center hexameric protein, partial [Planctomycetaceae bacterium]|nr:Nif3-like dinuclear metal center hexameric protein [Planctomycetaceae bacterium]